MSETMKKPHLFSIIGCVGCLLIVFISACGDDIDDDADDDDYNNDYDEYEHEYTHLEEALANALGKVPGEEITPDELATLTHLTVPEPLSSLGFPEIHRMALHRIVGALYQPEGVRSFWNPARRPKSVGGIDSFGAIKSSVHCNLGSSAARRSGQPPAVGSRRE